MAESKALPQRWAEGQNKYAGSEGHHVLHSTHLSLDLQGISVLLLALLSLLCIFFSSCFSTPPRPKYSLEQQLRTRDSLLVNVPVTKLRGCSSCLWFSEYLCAEFKREAGVCSSHSTQVRGVRFRLGLSLVGHSRESLNCCTVFSEGDERCGRVAAVVWS